MSKSFVDFGENLPVVTLEFGYLAKCDVRGGLDKCPTDNLHFGETRIGAVYNRLK